MEQITYLLFIKRLDELQTVKDRRANATGTPDPDPFFDEAQQDLRWQNFKARDPEIMYELVAEGVFPYLRLMGGDDSTYSHHGLQLDLLRSLDRREQLDPARDGGPDAIATEPSVRWALAHRLHATVAGMNLDNFLVRPHRREIETFADFRTWHRIDEDAEHAVREKLRHLPSDHEPDPDETREEAKRFDLIAFRLQLAALDGGKEYAKLRQKVRDIAEDLLGKTNIPAVGEQRELLEAVAGEEWWQDVTLPMLEDLRRRLRGLAELVDPKAKRKIGYTDFEDEFGEISEADIKDMPTGTDEQRFRQRARAYLLRHQNLPTVHKLRHNEQITEDDLAGLEEIFLAEAVASPEDLDEVRAAGGLGLFVRTLCGLDRQAAQRAFESFIAGMHLSASQLDFITLIVDVVTKRGVLDVGDLRSRQSLPRPRARRSGRPVLP